VDTRFDLTELGGFVAEAMAYGWPDNTVAREGNEFPGFWNTHYERGSWRYVDLWSGSSTDAGVQFVFLEDRPAWSCTYRGGLVLPEDLGDLSVEANEIFAFLVLALTADSPRPLAIRGPGRFAREDLTYTMSVTGDLESFLAFERIYRGVTCAYERVLIGGCFGDGVLYGSLLGDGATS
jgi:hypothetical protein